MLEHNEETDHPIPQNSSILLLNNLVAVPRTAEVLEDVYKAIPTFLFILKRNLMEDLSVNQECGDPPNENNSFIAGFVLITIQDLQERAHVLSISS